jgi:hypothetical protein
VNIFPNLVQIAKFSQNCLFVSLKDEKGLVAIRVYKQLNQIMGKLESGTVVA